MRIVEAHDIGAAVRAARKEQGLRLEDLALAAGVGVRFLSELERGKPSAQMDGVLRVLAAVGLELRIESRSS